MSGITSGIGLISGINRTELINQLIEIESRPITTLQQRVRGLDSQRTAFLELEAKLLSLQNAAARFTPVSLFRRFAATSSNEEALVVTANENASAGVYRYRVRSLATQHSLLSRGFADADQTPVGVGTLTLERAAARVNRGTDLDTLNAGQGVRRGVITLTDRSGASADVDLSGALTIEDVVEAINSETRVRVRASVTGLSSNGASGDRIVVEDRTGSQSGSLIIADRDGGFTAADLGIAGVSANGRIDGSDLVRLSLLTPLAALNDGNGVSRITRGAGPDLDIQTSYGSFGVSLSDDLQPQTDLRLVNSGQGVRLGVIRITDRGGRSAEIDLSAAVTVQDIREAIENADVAVQIAVVGSSIQIRDASDAPAATKVNLKIEDVSGFSAVDLGIEGDVASDTISGREIYRVSTVGDVLRAINLATGNHSFVQASLTEDGKRIRLMAMGFGNTVTVSSGAGSTAAADLGVEGAVFQTNGSFESRRLVSGLNTVLLQSLNGGAGVAPGTVRFTDGANRSSVIDFASASSLQDVIDLINADSQVSLRAAINSAGNGIVIHDEFDGPGTGVVIEDVAGTMAMDLGVATSELDAQTSIVNGGNLQLRYVSRQTRLSELNPAAGAFVGEFRIIDSTGATHLVSLASNLSTVGDVIDAIQLRTPDSIVARINETGDGVVIIDQTNGDNALTVEDSNGGRAAANLRLAGKAKSGEKFIDGTLEIRVSIGARDTLRDVAGKLNAAGAGVSASILNDGRGLNPFALTISSLISGRKGELVLDARGLDLGLQTLIRAQDAVVSIGANGGGGSKLISGSSNTLEEVVSGISLDLRAPGAQDVTVTVSQDVDAIVESIRAFVDGYNDVQSEIDEKTSFNQDTLERGILLGDSTIGLVRNRLHRMILQPFGGTGTDAMILASVGLRAAGNNRIEFDEEDFRAAYAADPSRVERFFTDSDRGFGDTLKDAVNALTNDFDGVLSRRDNAFAEQQELINDRIAGLNELLDAKRARLESQFIALENALAGLQSQQSALAGLVSQRTAGR